MCGSVRASDSRSARSSMRFMTSSSSTASTWAETPWCSSPTPQFSAAGTRPGVRILRSGKLSCQRTVTTHNRKEQQPSTTPTNGEAGVPPQGAPASSFKHYVWLICIGLPHRLFVAAIGMTAPTCQARALLTAIAPAPRSARTPAAPARTAASLPVFASPWEGAGVLRTGVVGAVGVTPAGV